MLAMREPSALGLQFADFFVPDGQYFAHKALLKRATKAQPDGQGQCIIRSLEQIRRRKTKSAPIAHDLIELIFGGEIRGCRKSIKSCTFEMAPSNADW
jgi:hypothetical protein